MSWHYLQEEEEGFSLQSYLDLIQSERSKSEKTQETVLSSGKETECLIGSQYGAMFLHSKAGPGEDQLTLSLEDSRARILVAQGKEPELPESVAGFGRSTQELLKKCNLGLSSRKTHRYCGSADSVQSSQTLPSWGMTVGGECWELGTSVKIINATVCGYLPTPSGVNGGKNHIAGRLDEWGGSSNPFRKTEIASVHCARFEEWMMGWPETWGALTEFEMDKYQLWLQTHSTYFQED